MVRGAGVTAMVEAACIVGCGAVAQDFFYFDFAVVPKIRKCTYHIQNHIQYHIQNLRTLEQYLQFIHI